jgi:peptide/nickel transport system substrate-binding protein
MKKYSKLIALVLALAMVFSVLTACSSKDDSASAGSDTAASDGQTATGEDTATSAAASGSDSQPSDDSAAPAGDYSLVIGSTVKNDTFDFSTYTDNPTQIRMCFEYLLDVLPSGELEYQLAESVDYVDDYTVKIKLRDNVYFTHGQKLCANDVMESYKAWASFGRESTFWETFDWDNSYIEDDLTLYFAFNRIYGPAISYMTCWAIFQADDIANYTADDWFNDPNGTGPYICTENIGASTISYQRKSADEYWGELPQAETVTYKYYSETSAMFIDFENGTLDAAFDISSTDAERILAGDCPDFTAYSLISAKDVTRIQLCETTPVFDDDRVREAFALAIDTEALAIANYGSLYIPATSTITTNVQYYENVGTNTYDPDRARELLAEAGYPNGGVQLTLLTNTGCQVLAEALQAMLAEVGFDLTVETYDIGTLIGMWKNNESDILIGETIDGAYFSDPVNIFANYSPTSTTASMAITDDEWVAAYDMATNHIDSETRAEGYSLMQHYVVEQHRLVNVCERVRMLVWNTNKIKDFPLGNPSNPTCLDVVFAY